MKTRTLKPQRLFWHSFRRAFSPDRLIADGIVLAVLILWAFGSSRTPEYILPNLSDVLRICARLFIEPELATHTYLSLTRVATAVALAQIIGGTLIVISYYLPVTRRFIDGRLTPLLNAFPTLGWAILALFWFGVGTTSVIFVEVAILLPFCIINLSTGFRTLDQETLEMARSFTRDFRRVLLLVILPMLFPYILASIRVSYGVAWKVALIAELFGTTQGLGYLLTLARTQFDSATLFATVIVIILLVVFVDRGILSPLEHRVFKHRATWAGQGQAL